MQTVEITTIIDGDKDFDIPMAILSRSKLTLISIIIYWPVIFLLTHTPLPKVAYQANLSDKSLHFMVYFILAFLLWGTIRPYKKVAWGKSTVWIILAVIVLYGVLDEWLQGFVTGRTADTHDLLADLAGALSSLAILSVFSFWPGLLVMSGMATFVLVNSYRTDISQLLPFTSLLLNPLLFAFFTGLTLYCIHTSRILFPNSEKGRFNGLISIILPCVLLITVKVGALMLHRHIAFRDILFSGLAIAITALIGHNAQKFLINFRKLRSSRPK